MFADFKQETENSEDCAGNCINEYSLKARHFIVEFHSDYSIVGEEVIVTEMNRFYQRIDMRTMEG